MANKLTKKEVLELRKKPCVTCGDIDKRGNHIIGYDHTDVDEILTKWYHKYDTLCNYCLFK